jgi:hypothetical protein
MPAYSDETKYEPALLVSYKRGEIASNIELHPVKLYEDGKIRNYSDHAWPREEPLADFRITCQLDPGGHEPYGFRAEYRDCYSVDLQRAEEMVKLLRKIDRELRKMSEAEGPPETFSAYVVRVARVLKVKRYGWTSDKRSMYDDNTYHWSNAEGLVYHVNGLINEHAPPLANS